MRNARPYGQASGGKAGRSGASRNPGKGGKRKPTKGGKASRLLLAVVTCCNLVLTLLLHILRRVEIIHAVESGEGAKVLLACGKETKGGERKKP